MQVFARSPNKSLRHFGELKEHGVGHATKARTLEELRDQVEHVIYDVLFATIQTVYRSVRRSCWECTVAEGGHFEQARA